MSIAENNSNNEAVVLLTDMLQLPLALQHYEVRQRISSPQDLDSCSVFEAWDSTLRRHVLIKHIHNQGKNLDALLSEARLVASLKHAAFLKVHGLEQDSDSLYIVMEAVKGVPLKEWIKHHQGNETLIAEHLYHLAAALEEAQTVGLVHGDLETSNLMVDQSGKIRLLNFSLRPKLKAQVLQQRNQLNQADAYQGIAYLAPERFSDVEPSACSEVFALGTIAYEMLTGALPFASLNGLALVAAQVQTCSDQWAWPISISHAARELVLAMTQREMNKRINYIEVMQACQTMRPDDPISLGSTSLQLSALEAKLGGIARTRRYRRYIVISLLVLLCGLGVWQAKPYWPQIVKALKPYSESREMEQGIAALARYAQVPNPDQLEKSNEHFERILERSPNNAKAVGYMSLVYMSRYNNEKRDEIWLQKAKASAQQAMSLDPNLAVSQIANAKVLQWHHRLEEALDAVDIALKIEPTSLLAWTNKARILLELGEVKTLHAFTLDGMKQHEDDRVLPELHGVACGMLGDARGAEDAYRLSIRRQPDSVNAYSLLADLLDGQGRAEEAMQFLQQGLQIRPNAQLYAAFGKAMFVRGKYVEAADAFEKAVSPQKGVVGSYFRWFQFAEALMWVPGREKEGLDAYRNAKKLLEIRLARSPDDAFIMSHMSLIQARLGEFEAAKKTIKTAIDIGKQSDSAYFYGAAVFELAGDRSNALTMIARAKDLGTAPLEINTHPIFNELRKDHRFHP